MPKSWLERTRAAALVISKPAMTPIPISHSLTLNTFPSTLDRPARSAMVGNVEAHREKLHKLASIGVTQFNIYLMCGEEEETLEKYKEKILPALRR